MVGPRNLAGGGRGHASLLERGQLLVQHRQLHGVVEAGLLEVSLQVVDLDDRPTIKVRKLSGGQRRRLAFAQALLGDPELLVLDEPTTGLDPEQRAVFRAAVSGRAPGSSVLLATHQTADVEAICDAVVVLDRGQVRFSGTVAELVATAAGEVTVDAAPASGALASWRDATGAIRSVGGTPAPTATAATPSVEDAYLLLVGTSSELAR